MSDPSPLSWPRSQPHACCHQPLNPFVPWRSDAAITYQKQSTPQKDVASEHTYSAHEPVTHAKHANPKKGHARKTPEIYQQARTQQPPTPSLLTSVEKNRTDALDQLVIEAIAWRVALLLLI